MKRARVIKVEPPVVKVQKVPKGTRDIVVTPPVEEVKEQPKSKWLVVSGGITLLRDRTKSYEKGETFEADEDEIPMAFRDLIKPLSPPAPPKPVREQPKYSLQPVVPTAEEEDEDNYVPLYDVINDSGKVISEKSLPKDEAEELLKGLNK